MKIVYGTTNQSKLDLMKPIANALNFELIGLNDVNIPLPDITENGKDPLENAEIKARAYFKALKKPVFSCDSGLYFDGLPDELQPMTHIRRVNGKVLSDNEMTEYYASLARSFGGKLIARYRNAVYFIVNDKLHFSSMSDSLSSEPFILCDVPHRKTARGFPLDRLSIDIKSGKYYYDLDRAADNLAVADGLTAFFKETLANIVE